jgi:hypothetical protein
VPGESRTKFSPDEQGGRGPWPWPLTVVGPVQRSFRDHGSEQVRVGAGARRGCEAELRSAVLALVELQARLRLGLGGVEDRLWSGGDSGGAEPTVARQR